MFRGTAQPTKLIVVDGTLYFADGLTPGNITAVSVSDGTATPLAAEQSSVTDMVVDAQSVFWLEGDSLRQVSRDGSGPSTLANQLVLPVGLADEDTSLFWVDRGSETAPGDIVTAMKSGGAVSEIAPGQNYESGQVGALAIDGDQVYFGGWLGELAVVSRSGGAVTILVPSQSPAVIGVQGGFVYWINATQAGSGIAGLWRVSVTGEAAQSLDPNAIGNSLVFGGGMVYYLTSSAITSHAL